MLKPGDSVRYVSGVGPKLALTLNKLGIETAEDLLYYFPRRYLDRSKLLPISGVKEGEEVTVVGVVNEVRKSRSPRRRVRILSVGIFDGTGYLYGVWFNQDFHAQRLREGVEVVFSGKVTFSYGQLQMINPSYDILGEADAISRDTVHTARIIPIYPATSTLSSNMIRRLTKNLLDSQPEISDPLPATLRDKYGYFPLQTALYQAHFPDDDISTKRARERLVFDELFTLELGLVLRKRRLEKDERGIQHKTAGLLLDKFFEKLPFSLTESQKRVIREIQEDMARQSPMHRLLQGEVGSGKTVVAVAALLTTVSNGYQGAIMAPTEVLAEQHLLKIGDILPRGVRVALLTGSTPPKLAEELKVRIKRGEIDIAIGTHALIQEGVKFEKLGLAVVDEQHRFGVRQRINLREKGPASDGTGPASSGASELPDVLVMTATPIPRTIALTLYGDLDISVLDELPAGRKEIETIVAYQRHRDDAYDLIRQQVRMGRQAYIVCPLIDESDKLQVKAAVKEAERLKEEVFPDLRVALLHGQMKSAEKEKIMADFRRGDLDILITTTVIEVGIDVPNVTVMLIEDADRFGLSQLHQLRGRIGRGEHKSFCILFADPTTEEAKERMRAIANSKDGFALAEEDLRIRGEGQLFGPRQSGLPDLKIAKLLRDMPVLVKAREEAFRIIEKDPLLRAPENSLLLEEVRKKFTGNIEWLFSG
ncbi:MAG: ATP-dependent DNA helicase RecG [Actinomycetota bacterium]